MDNNTPPASDATKRNTGPLFILAAILFGLGMALLGFFAGSAFQDRNVALPTLAPAVEVPETAGASELALAPTPAAEASAADLMSQPAAQAEASPTLEATTAPEATATSAATATAEATATSEPAASPTPVPTAEPEVASPDGVSPLEDADLATLFEVWEVVADQFDGEVPPLEDVLSAAISGSLETLDDDYTRYAPPDVAERLRQDMEGSVEGIGAFVRENEDGWTEIVRPIDGQPADLAGLRAGDIILAVDGESVEGQSLDEVVLKVRGPRDTQVVLTIGREGEPEPLEFTIVRARYEVPIIESELIPPEQTGGGAIGYIHLTEFNRNAEESTLEALQALLAEQPAGIILDLRDNPGGFLDQSVAVADIFLPDGVVLFERSIRGLDEEFRSDDGDVGEQIPLVVLINPGSASASEIVAGALQDRERATVIGETSFGKGSVQLINTLTDGSELRVTTARWYTPDNRTIDKEGITPDIEVATPEDLGGDEDPQLQRAIEFLITGQ